MSKLPRYQRAMLWVVSVGFRLDGRLRNLWRLDLSTYIGAAGALCLTGFLCRQLA
jgi:hypothetical protein